MIALGTGLLAVVLVVGFRPLVGHTSVVAHEGGHALVGTVLGMRPTRVELKHDRTGSTGFAKAAWFLPDLIVTSAGYLGPSLFGLGFALALAHNQAAVVLGVSLGLLVLLLLINRSWVGFAVIVALGGAMGLALQHGPGPVQTAVACTWVWLLLVGGIADMWEHRAGGMDHAALRKRTWLPVRLFVGLFLVVGVVALFWGGGLLLGLVSPPG